MSAPVADPSDSPHVQLPRTTDGEARGTAPAHRRDQILLFAARGARGFGSGALSIVIALDLIRVGYSTLEIGILLGIALGGGAAWAIAVPRLEHRWGRRIVFSIAATAFAAGGLLLWLRLGDPIAVLLALLLGGVVAGGADVSPLGALEQATLVETSPGELRTRTFAWYNLVGYAGVSAGALVAGPLQSFSTPGWGGAAHDLPLLLYGIVGAALLPVYGGLSAEPLAAPRPVRREVLSPSARPVVYSLSSLFAVDAFAGGMIVNSLVVFYFATRFGASEGSLGLMVSLSSIAAAVSLLVAAPLARRFGLVNTMVFTHIPSNVLLALVVVAPNLFVGAVLWIARATLSQMDVPTRQSYTQSVVAREDRAAAAGYTTAARSFQAFGAPVTGAFLAAAGPFVAAPFVIAGGVKTAYDVAIYRRFRGLRPPEERTFSAGP